MDIINLITTPPVSTFLLITYGITYTCWFTLSMITKHGEVMLNRPLQLILFFLGEYSPILAVLYLHHYRRLSLPKFGTSANYWIKSVVITVLGTLFLVLYFFGSSKVSNLRIYRSFKNVFTSLPYIIISEALSEIGWRGFFHWHILGYHEEITAALIVGVIWALWYLPLFFIPGRTEYVGRKVDSLFIPSFIIMCCANSLVFATCYQYSRNVLVCVLLHAFYNALIRNCNRMPNLLESLFGFALSVGFFFAVQYVPTSF